MRHFWIAVAAPIAALAVLAAGVAVKTSFRPPFTEADLLRTVLAKFDKSKIDPFEPRREGQGKRLRGIDEREAMRMLAACSAAKWRYVGREVRCPPEPNSFTKFELFECRLEGSSLVARLAADYDLVDHVEDLAPLSELTACRPDLCPDFAVGEPTEDMPSCDTPFKADKTGIHR